MKLAMLLIVPALALSACGGSKTKQVASNPQVKADEAKAQAKVQRCISHANFITHSGRQAFIRCVAPPGQEAKIQKCATGKIASDGVLTKRARHKLSQDVAGCLVR